jgi:predicted nucleotidyltransferase
LNLRTEPIQSIADALFPRVRQRLLAALFGQPQRSFYTNELVRLAGSGIGGVQRELASLSACGLVNVSAKGNQKHYQANGEAPVFEELRAIVRKTFGVADVLRASLSPLASQVDRAFVFGSVASGEARAGSDIDVMLVSDSLSLEEVFAAFAPLESSLGQRIHPTLYTLPEFNKRLKNRNPFLIKVMERPRIPLVEHVHGQG